MKLNWDANRFLPVESKDCMNSASYEYRNMSARRGAQFVPMGMPIIMLGQMLKSLNFSFSVLFFAFNFAYYTNKAPYNKSSRQARIQWPWHLCFLCCHVAFWTFSVRVGAFVTGLIQISSFFSLKGISHPVFYGGLVYKLRRVKNNLVFGISTSSTDCSKSVVLWLTRR